MIRVSYNRKDTVMTIKGHAQAGPKGMDLVCAGASVLGWTLCAVCEDNEERFLPIITAKDGDLRVECRPSRSFVTMCRRAMDVIFTGFEQLANAYPEHLTAERED